MHGRPASSPARLGSAPRRMNGIDVRTKQDIWDCNCWPVATSRRTMHRTYSARRQPRTRRRRPPAAAASARAGTTVLRLSRRSLSLGALSGRVVLTLPSACSDREDDMAESGFKISAVNQRNFGENFVFGSYRYLVYRCFSVYFVPNFENLK